MENKKSLVEIVENNTSTVNETIDYMDKFTEEFTNKVSSSKLLSKIELIGYAMQLEQIAKLMDSCEHLIKKTCQALLVADLDEEGDDIEYCFEHYSDCANRYEKFKKKAYKKVLSEEYLEMIFEGINN